MSHYPVQIEAADISAYRRGNTGIDYINTFSAERSGPHIMLSAVVHGNELCGAIVLDWLLGKDVRPLRGTLTFAFMNVTAYESFDPLKPETSRFVDEDFNRLWARDVLEGKRDSVELRRAREVRPAVDRTDYLLDIHSMQHPTPPLMLCGAATKGRNLAREVGYPINIVSDFGHAAGRRLRDYHPFADDGNPHNALLVECGQHWAPESVTVARNTALRFLQHFGMLSADFVAEHSVELDLAEPRVVEVSDAITVRTERFQFKEDFRGMETIPAAGTLIATDGALPVSTPYDNCVLIMPSRRLRVGQTAVRLGRLVEP
jgi:predicted deacylase